MSEAEDINLEIDHATIAETVFPATAKLYVNGAQESGVIQRQFEAQFTPGQGRTVDVRVVPYGTPAHVSDGGPVYREEWAPGCFDEQLVAGHRLKVLLNFEHRQGVSDIVGKGIALRSESDGLHGSFELLETSGGETALELVRSGILDGVSLEAKPKKSIRTVEGIVRRVKAHLVNVALCRTPAFADARVLALRQLPDEVVLDEDLLPVPIDPAILERARKASVIRPL